MRFVTRANVHIDRIATAWAIRRFIDPGAAFLFVDRTDNLTHIDAIPFDMRGAEIGHHGGRCSFEALLDKYELRDPALRRMGEIIRVIDVPVDDEPPPAHGWVAPAFEQLRSLGLGDEERMTEGALLCDRLYRECADAAVSREPERERRAGDQ